MRRDGSTFLYREGIVTADLALRFLQRQRTRLSRGSFVTNAWRFNDLPTKRFGQGFAQRPGAERLTARGRWPVARLRRNDSLAAVWRASTQPVLHLPRNRQREQSITPSRPGRANQHEIRAARAGGAARSLRSRGPGWNVYRFAFRSFSPRLI